MAVVDPLLLTMPGYEAIAAGMDAEAAPVSVERFANGELGVTLPAPVERRDCLLLGTVAPPGDRAVAFLLAADTVARHGARSLHALLPYLAYARQDAPEHGRSVAAAWLGGALAACAVDRVTTIDIHSDAARGLLGLPTASMSPAHLLAGGLAPAGDDTTVVAPDAGARVRAHALACSLEVDRPIAWLEKERHAGGVRHLRLAGEVSPRAVVVDDILDTGGTLVSCCRELRSRGVREIDVAVTHGLFTGSRWRELADLGVRAVHVTDSVPDARAAASELVRVHPCAPLLGDVVARRSRVG